MENRNGVVRKIAVQRDESPIPGRKHLAIRSVGVSGPVKTEEDPLDPDPPANFRKILAAIRYLEDAVQSSVGPAAFALRYGFF